MDNAQGGKSINVINASTEEVMGRIPTLPRQ